MIQNVTDHSLSSVRYVLNGLQVRFGTDTILCSDDTLHLHDQEPVCSGIWRISIDSTPLPLKEQQQGLQGGTLAVCGDRLPGANGTGLHAIVQVPDAAGRCGQQRIMHAVQAHHVPQMVGLVPQTCRAATMLTMATSGCSGL